jgi:TetR/AcrR family transcriptional regulator, fatty acid metabolism regulator protein
MVSNDKRAQILIKAEDLFSENGFAGTTISEIAQAAEVADSVIYQHFINKEDLLFSIAYERIKEATDLLTEQLLGIQDPLSRLSKMIWFHLRYNDTHQKYARILLLDCQFSKNFYKAKTNQVVRQYVSQLTMILNEGIRVGVFRNDVNVHILQDIILGAINYETISKFAIKEIDDSTVDFDAIISLVLSMLSPIESMGNDSLSKSERILLAAEKVFAEYGFSKAKIMQIAEIAGVAEGTVYEHYKNKEDLLLSIPRKRFDQYRDQLRDVFHINDPLRKLRRIISYHFSLFLREPNFSKVFLLYTQFNRKFYQSQAFESFRNYFMILEEVVLEGIGDGVIRADVNPRIFRNMFLGTFSNIAIRWLIMGKGKSYDKLYEIDKVVSVLVSAVISKKK